MRLQSLALYYWNLTSDQTFQQLNSNNIKRGKYFRIAADVIVDGESLADVLIEAGVAIKYDGGKKIHKWCE